MKSQPRFNSLAGIVRRLALAPTLVLCLTLCLAVAPAPTFAQIGDEELPAVFVETLLDLPDDITDAARSQKRLLLYFGQAGCPYCKELMHTSFSQTAIVDKTKKHFLPIALNLFGDREVKWTDGQTRSEKELARFLKIQFTPTVLLLNEKGDIIARINGYYPPHRFSAALDYAAQRKESKITFAEHMKTVPRDGANPTLNQQPFFLKPPFDLRRQPGSKTLAVLFESRHCAPCDELHREGFKRPEVLAAIQNLDLARFSLSAPDTITTPDGRRLSAAAWARELQISYTPSVLFFDSSNKEIFRLEAYVRPFHLASSFEYISSNSQRKEPQFQRWLQQKAERMKQQGEKAELWK